ncbi:uncharacterized protein [Watersipora subatra]|uniref:uncharacterized protein n=1 Tax=Watersipora subatra TaxID=2589382 RepID=UPI00355C5BEA
MDKLVCLGDFEREAKVVLPKAVSDYFSTGADDEQTVRENSSDFKRLYLRPRMMRDVSRVSLGTTILGETVSFPVGIAPSGMHMLAHPIGEMGTAKAAEALGSCMCLSTGANVSVDDIAKGAPGLLRWFQLYVCKDRGLSRQLVERAERAGFRALVVTVDRPEVGRRRSSIRNKFAMPTHLSYKNLEGLTGDLTKNSKESQYATIHSMFDNSLTWKDIAWLASITSLPIIAKGVLTGEDAEEAIKAGCSAVYVSNHGGRQLDGVYSSISALPEVVKAVGGRVEVYMDGGIRTGTDVLKALALGARAVFIGRPAIYGLAVGGEDGVRKVLEILRAELKLAMQLTGIVDVKEIPKNLLMDEMRRSKL